MNYRQSIVALAALLLVAGCSSSRVEKNNNQQVAADTVRRDTVAVTRAPVGPAAKVWLDPAEWVINDTARYVSRTILVRAEGPGSVVIAEARPSCGCILATVLRNRVSEKEPGQIRVAIDMHKMPPGGFYELHVVTNSIVSPAISMEIRRPAK